MVSVARLPGSLTGKAEGDRGPEAALKDGSPGGVGGVPAVPGPRRVRGPPGFPARGASGRVAAAPPSPSERSAAVGPKYCSHQGEAARCGSGCPLGSARSPSVAATRLGSGISQRPSAVLCSAQPQPPRPPASRSAHRSGPRPPRRVAQSAERRGGPRAQACPLSPAEEGAGVPRAGPPQTGAGRRHGSPLKRLLPPCHPQFSSPG